MSGQQNSLKLIGTEKDFLKRTPLAQALRSAMGPHETARFSKAKDTVIRTKWHQPTEWENIFLTNYTSVRRLISKIPKGSKKLDIKKTNNPIKNGIQI